jgi:acetyl-CoA carboxylase biotin carboxyl carrier protein
MASKKAKSSAAKGSAAAAASPQAEPVDRARVEVERIRTLARAMSEGDLSELEIEDSKSGLRLRLRRGPEPSNTAMHVVSGLGPGYAPAAAAPAASSTPAATGPAGAAAVAAAARQDSVPFTSPMVGTFYRSASPEAEPFIEVGARCGEDTTLCIIEAMKVMNEIKAELRGTIVEVLVQNGEPVEFGQPLFLIRPA